MMTSYFRNTGLRGKLLEQCVAISTTTPPEYRGHTFHRLAPPWDLLREWKDGTLPEEDYALWYYSAVLERVNPEEVLKYVTNDGIMLCWERVGYFCHRHIVADWLRQTLGLDVQEFKVPREKPPSMLPKFFS